MPNQAVSGIAATQPWSWCSRMLWSIVTLFILGAVARALVSNEHFDARKFTGEVIIASIGAVIMYSLGLMQGMTEVQIVSFGALASLGGLRGIEWTLKIINTLQRTGNSND